jgi:hypothetical protein
MRYSIKDSRYYEISCENFFSNPNESLSNLLSLEIELFNPQQDSFLYCLTTAKPFRARGINHILTTGTSKSSRILLPTEKGVLIEGSFAGARYFHDASHLFDRHKIWGPLFLVYDSQKYLESPIYPLHFVPKTENLFSEGLLAVVLVDFKKKSHKSTPNISDEHHQEVRDVGKLH